MNRTIFRMIFGILLAAYSSPSPTSVIEPTATSAGIIVLSGERLSQSRFCVQACGDIVDDVDENWHGGRRYMAQESMNKLLNPELEEPSKQSFDLVDKLLELEAQNAIYTI